MKALRVLEIALHVLAAVFLGQTVATHYLNLKQYIPSDILNPGAVLSAVWFVLAVFLYPRRVLGQG